MRHSPRSRAGGPRGAVEELLEGPEVSLFALCDGHDAVALAAAQDFKRAYDGDEGPNTGGMGAYSPAPRRKKADATAELVARVHGPVLAELERRGAPFVGLLYAGLMLDLRRSEVACSSSTAGSAIPRPRQSSRCSSPTCSRRSPLPRAGTGGTELRHAAGAAVTVVLAADRYPAGVDRGAVITGLDAAEAADALVFHAGTALNGERVVTNGGRIVGVTGRGDTIGAARTAAYEAVGLVAFRGMRYRTDIAEAAADGAAG